MDQSPRVGVWSPGRSDCGPLLAAIAVMREAGVWSPDRATDARRLVDPPPVSSHDIDEMSRAGQAFSIVHPIHAAENFQPANLRGLFSPHLIAALNAGRARVVLDFSNEGIFVPQARDLSAFLGEAGIARRDGVTVVCQNRAAEIRASSFAHLPFDYFLVMTWRRLREQERAGRLAPLGPIGAGDDLSSQARILCLNATPRITRVASLLALIHCGAIDPGSFSAAGFPRLPWVSFPGLEYGKESNREDELLRYLRTAGLDCLERHVPTLLAMAPLTVDRFSDTGNGLFDKIDTEPYRRTVLSCVTETTTMPGLERITEKTLKPALLGHPLVVFGPRGAVALLRDLGFRTFDRCIDHSYDTIAAEGDRIMAAARSAAGFLEGIRSRTIAGADLASDSRRNVAWGQVGFAEQYRDRHLVPLIDTILHRN